MLLSANSSLEKKLLEKSKLLKSRHQFCCHFKFFFIFLFCSNYFQRDYLQKQIYAYKLFKSPSNLNISTNFCNFNIEDNCKTTELQKTFKFKQFKQPYFLHVQPRSKINITKICLIISFFCITFSQSQNSALF